MTVVDIARVMEKWEQAWWVWPGHSGDPRLGQGVEQTYTSWMLSDVSVAAKYVSADCFIQPGHLSSLVRFRLAAHKLQVVVGRWAKVLKQGGGRRCRWCLPFELDGSGDNSVLNGYIEDEKHVLLECPRYHNIRQRFSSLLEECESDMLRLMCHENQAAVAHFVHAVMKSHAEPILCEESESDDHHDETCGDSCFDDESELVEMSSGELLLSTLMPGFDV